MAILASRTLTKADVFCWAPYYRTEEDIERKGETATGLLPRDMKVVRMFEEPFVRILRTSRHRRKAEEVESSLG